MDWPKLQERLRPFISKKKLKIYAVTGITVSLGFFIIFGIYFFFLLSTVPKLEGMSFSHLKLLTQNKIMQKWGIEFQEWIPLYEVNREFLYAIVASEDSTFFGHTGINFYSIRNALKENIRQGKYMRGGSTISQQVVKNVFLSNEKTIKRKIKEAIITKSLEKTFSKEQILEIYINLAEFGPNIIGVKSASRHYFNIEPSEINAPQGVFISLMLPSPKRNYEKIYENGRLSDLQKFKIQRTLKDMLYHKWISETQFAEYQDYEYLSDLSYLPKTIDKGEDDFFKSLDKTLQRFR